MRLGAEKADYRVYKVLKPLTVKSGIAGPAFGKGGGGVQHALPNIVANLVESKHLRLVEERLFDDGDR